MNQDRRRKNDPQYPRQPLPVKSNRFEPRGHSPFVEQLLSPVEEATPVEPVPPKRSRRPARLNPRLKKWLGPDWSVAVYFMLPSILLLGGIVAFPFLSAFYLSFTNTQGYDQPGAFIGLRNYMVLWQDDYFRASVFITLEYTFWLVALKLLVGLGAALLLHRLKRFTSILTGLLLLPWIMPEVVRAVLWRGMLDPFYGVINRLLLDLGLIERSITFFGSFQLSLPSVILVNVWGGFPLFTVVLLAGLKGIDRELYEAASIDGAGSWRRFLHITLPGLRTVMVIVILLATIWAFNEYTSIAVLTGGGPAGTTLVYSIRVFEAARGGRFGLGVALGMTLIPILALFIWLLSRYLAPVGPGVAVASTRQRGLVSKLLNQLGRLFRRGLRLVPALFWLIIDGLEYLVTALGQLLRRHLFRSAAASDRSARLTRRIGLGLIGLLVIFLLIIELFPFYWAIVTSFKTNLQITTFSSVLWPQPWTLDQYRRVLSASHNLSTWYRNTLIVSLITPFVTTFIGALGAYGLTRLRWRGRRIFASLVLIAYLMPGVLLLIPLSMIFRALGLLESLWPLLIAYPSFTLPFALWMMMGYYAAIPEELESAGLIDGCTRFGVFYQIVLPLVRPALIAIFLFGVTHAWGEFLFASFFRGDSFFVGDRLTTLSVALATMVASGVAPWGEVTSTSVLMTIPVVIFYALSRNFMIEGLTAGAIKGGG